jgi:hypothetical protein
VDTIWVISLGRADPLFSSPQAQPAAAPAPPDVNSLMGMVAPAAPASDPLSSAPPPQEESNQPSARIRGVTLSAENTVGKSEGVAAAMMERVNDMEAAKQKAVKEFKDREEAVKKESDGEDEVRRRLEPKIKEWSEEYGKKRPLRALISSMEKVLWPNSGYKPVNLGDILDPKKARRAYLKASLIVHPDKVRDLGPEERFIAKRVFDALSQANQEFMDSGMR